MGDAHRYTGYPELTKNTTNTMYPEAPMLVSHSFGRSKICVVKLNTLMKRHQSEGFCDVCLVVPAMCLSTSNTSDVVVDRPASGSSSHHLSSNSGDRTCDEAYDGQECVLPPVPKQVFAPVAAPGINVVEDENANVAAQLRSLNPQQLQEYYNCIATQQAKMSQSKKDSFDPHLALDDAFAKISPKRQGSFDHTDADADSETESTQWEELLDSFPPLEECPSGEQTTTRSFLRMDSGLFATKRERLIVRASDECFGATGADPSTTTKPDIERGFTPNLRKRAPMSFVTESEGKKRKLDEC